MDKDAVKSKELSTRGMIAAGSYMATSVALIVFNKIALSVYHFPYANFITMLQMLLSLLLLIPLRKFDLISFHIESNLVEPSPLLMIGWSSLRGSAVISGAYLLYLVLGMFALRGVSIPMYTTLRRMTVMFVMLLETTGYRQTYSAKVKISVSIMVLGALIAGARDLSFDLKAYVAVLIYDIATAIYLVLIARIGKSTNLNPWGLMYSNTLLSLPLLALLNLATGELQNAWNWEGAWSASGFQFAMFGSSVLAFMLNFTIFWNTTVNSALTQTVAGQFKDLVTIIVGFFAFGDIQNDLLNIIGITVGFAGSVAYAIARYQEQQTQNK
eukprot:TRINITY_DN4459_c0_g1_i1.p1 TRINITY_DN4459_c0_g1~~TRINITY_DN4459_c0_g1_i1.p1  ORF type:complete len:327 (+),score=41.22 TRINITY_DN4459_c0_g1_i1:258-1238(+)